MKVLNRIGEGLGRIGSGMKKIGCAIGRRAKKHKVLTLVLVLVLGAGAFLSYRSWSAVRAVSGKMAYNFVRTTTLTKGSLSDSVSTTGTVGSANTSTVSYASSGNGSAAPKIKTVQVAVGDTVAAGDVVITLDTADIEESIAKEKENIADEVASAQDKYDTALAAYNKAVSTAENYESSVATAAASLATAQTNYNNAVSSVASFQTTYNNAAAAQEAAGNAYNAKLAAYNEAVSANNAAQAAAAADPANQELSAAASAANATMNTADAEQQNAKAAYENLVQATAAAQTALNNAKSACNYQNYEQAVNTAQNNYAQARSALDQYEKTVETCTSTLKQTKETLTKVSSSDALESLQEQLAACSLKAETAGKVTALNASVGSTPNGTLATIQDTGALKITITIEEADIHEVAVGMSCYITTDATANAISGTLTQIDPVANQNGSFGAEVTVNDADSGLLIGMNATVEIVKSETEDCFMVPIDAVGTEEGSSDKFVYRKTGGSGADSTFEKVTVTTGASNDYYIEINAAELTEGDIVRSSADLTQGVEETAEEQTGGLGLGSLFGGLFGGQSSGQGVPGGTPPSGNGAMGSGNRGNGGNGGTPPSGGMPSGGPGGQG